MANPHRGEVAFEADGNSYTLRFSANAICELEEATGRGALSLMMEFQALEQPRDAKGKALPETPAAQAERLGRIKMTTVRALFWAMLRDRQPEITLREAGELIEAAGGLIGVANLIARTFELSQPEAPNGAGTKGVRPTKKSPTSGTSLNS